MTKFYNIKIKLRHFNRNNKEYKNKINKMQKGAPKDKLKLKSPFKSYQRLTPKKTGTSAAQTVFPKNLL